MDREDILLSMSHTPTEDYMAMIAAREKNHEFRRKLYPASIKRIWFYETAPKSAVTYICEVSAPKIRPAEGATANGQLTDWKLEENGIGNKDFNDFHRDYQGYDFAYPIQSCYKLKHPITLPFLKSSYGIGGAPRGMVYVPESMKRDVPWNQQVLVWART